ncbi:zinc finger protein 576, tandem duplicate 1 [Antennarius striatus]|uniref:zinc finger protein 576, tandem duplicate 1 n=1 Tax=Antennarius striatus TaxID=241820 RepID=UPI0035B07527
MQSLTESSAGPKLVITPTTEKPQKADTGSQPVQGEPDSPEEARTSAISTETDTMAPQENGTHVEAPAGMAVTHALEKETAAQQLTGPSKNTGGKKFDSSSKEGAPVQPSPDKNANSSCEGPKTKKTDKAVRDGRKYVPSKKAMIDPLKMDMSKPLVVPLTSSQLSLQCIECHIIFSDQKSKVRHLKLSHPAEYEQCILRNALFACYVCDRHFTNSTELMAHQKAHVEKKPFKCPICSQAFKKSSELTLHKKIHFGLDGYACTDCGKPCKTMTLLKYHRRTHTGERPYICKECGKRFTMSKALQKHMVSHFPEGAEEEDKAKEQVKKDDGASTKYPCCACKATFKSTKTRLHHIKTKHKMLPAAAGNVLAAGQQKKQSTPIITPIPFCQPALLQVEPNGPLQKVDANIDTEQIRRLIESLGNVQKVNQVVILGQVPPHAPPLAVQQLSQVAESGNFNLNPPQVDFMGMKQNESNMVGLAQSNVLCEAMEQTIILEPITPEGQLETPSFTEMSSHIVVGENIELTLVPSEQTGRLVGEEMHQIFQQSNNSAIQSGAVDQMVCQNEVDMLKQNLEETVILELTPALIPTVELEQSQTVPQEEIPSSSVVPTTGMEKIPEQTPDQTVIAEPEVDPEVPPMLHTVELELIPLQREQQDFPSGSFVPSDTLTQTPSVFESNPKKDVDFQMQTVSPDHVHSVMDGDTSQNTQEESTQKNVDKEPPEKPPVNKKRNQNLVENLNEINGPSPEDKVLSQGEAKQVPQISELPISVMSAQELVKVRKRKPARAFIFQGYMQELVGSMYSDDFPIQSRPAKRQRSKKSHLVVKFGPQSKEKNKTKKSSQQRKQAQGDVMKEKKTSKKIPETKVPLQKKGRKKKQDKNVGHSVSQAQIKSPPLTQDLQMKEDTRKNKMKKQKAVAPGCVTHVSEHKTAASPIFKKTKQAKEMQKSKTKNAKDGNRKKRQKKEKINTASPDIAGPQKTQDALLLLKGHKQPQLKVYKLDTPKASSQTKETSPRSPTVPQQSKGNKLKHPVSDSTNNFKAEGKKKGGRPKKNLKALSLLSSLQVSCQSSETLPPKQKATRKRKASSKVEIEGVISSHSKRALECKDCGERFSEVSSLQKHKATVHIIESPGLTYTNGNIFEGVSKSDLYRFPKQHNHLVGMINAATDWDTEPEVGEMALEDRERNVSFPALIPSPSLPGPPTEVEMSGYGDKGGNKAKALDQSPTSPEVHPPSDQKENSKTPHTKSCEKGESLTLGEDKQEEGTLKNVGSEAEVQGVVEEDIKEDLLLEVDLVTVGEQNESHEPTSHEVNVPQIESNEPSNRSTGQVSNETEKSLASQTVSCSTHQMDVKEEAEEILVQKKKESGAVVRNTTRGWRRTGCLKRDMISKTVSVIHANKQTESDKEQEECRIVYEMHPVTSDTEANFEEESSEEQVVFELKSVTTSVEEVMNQRGLQGGDKQDRDQSPGIILEKFLMSRQRMTCDQETNIEGQAQVNLENEVQVLRSQEIKVEESLPDALAVATPCQNGENTVVQPQHHRDIRTVLVKEESTQVFTEVQSMQSSRHVQWNADPVNNEDTSSSLINSAETIRECHESPDFNTSQCIFYPVKEEDREVLLGAARSVSGNVTTGTPTDAILTDHQETDNNLDLQDFLLQSSDEEDADSFELADPQLDTEAEILTYFYKNETSNARQPDEISQNFPNSVSQLETLGDRNKTREPIEYFSKYFGWDTWVEIASCTNELSKLPNPVTGREVAQFVGIHIAMGTLKFPSLKLYWEDLTKVPLIAEAMPLSRFHQLTRILKFAAKDSVISNMQEGRHDCGFQNAEQCKNPPSRQSELFQQRNKQNDLNSPAGQTDPLWKTRPLLHRFKAGCLSLRWDDHYVIDQYPLPLTRKIHNNSPSLICTTLIGFGGFLLNVDLKVGLSSKDDAVENIAPKGSMVYLCKQEHSTPAMLERLLLAGVHGAGRVGGARGQIGDEFVSSDGKLMLRRSHWGFILSTAGNSQRNMGSLIDNFEKAQMSAHMSRDLRNLYSIPLTTTAPTCWPQAVLWYLTDLALVNSWLLYRQDHRVGSTPLTLMDFRLQVSKALILSIDADSRDSIPSQPPIEKTHTANDTPNPSLLEESPLPDAATRFDGSGHWPEQLGEGEGGRCRFKDCRRTSRVLCLKCCVFLCISRNHNCFLNFHSQGSLGKQ